MIAIIGPDQEDMKQTAPVLSVKSTTDIVIELVNY